MNNLINNLYKASRMINKTASVLRDVEVISTGDTKKIINHFERKAVNKYLYKQERKINNTINNKVFKNDYRRKDR